MPWPTKPPTGFTVLAAALLLLLTAALPAAGQAPLTIKLATLAPEGSSWMKIFRAAAEEAREKTGGAIQFKIYPGGVMGDERDMIRKMHIGQLQAAVLTSAGLSTIYPEIDVMQIPFLFDSYAEVDHAAARLEPLFREGLAAGGYELIGWSEAGFVHMLATVPADTLEALRKAKVWIWNDSPMSIAIFKEAGVPGVPLTLPDVLVGLQTGLVEVVYAPPTAAIALQWFTRVKYVIDLPLLYLIGGVVVKKSEFDKLQAAHRRTVAEVFERHFAALREVIRRENGEALATMQKQGVRLLRPAPEEIVEFKRISEAAIGREGGRKFSAATRDELRAVLDAFRKSRP
jgi:TRAP-type C4-dicarboxylate transport system substrate-binding protein